MMIRAYAFRVLMSVVALVLVSGCTTDEITFRIAQNQPTPDCGESPSTDTSTYKGSGIVDVQGADAVNALNGYVMFPLIFNDNPSHELNGVERNGLILTGFKVELILDESFGDTSGIDPELLEFDQDIGGSYMSPNGRTTPAVEVIKLALLNQLTVPAGERPFIEVRITAIADYSGDLRESNVFSFPVEVCDGCLVDVKADCAEVANAGYCGFAQDGAVDCCEDAEDGFVCGAVVAEE